MCYAGDIRKSRSNSFGIWIVIGTTAGLSMCSIGFQSKPEKIRLVIPSDHLKLI